MLAMANIANKSSSSSVIEAANRAHSVAYIGYVVILVLAAFFTWLTWRTGNRVQDAMHADSDARIREADAKGEQAKLEAAKANERTGELERSNLELRNKVADVEQVAAKQQERAAKAELATEELRRQNLEMQESLSPRVLAWSGRIEMRLKSFAGTRFDLQIPAGDIETKDFGDLIGTALTRAGWKFETGGTVHGPQFPEGVTISVDRDSALLPAAMELASYLLANRSLAVVDISGHPPSGQSSKDKLLINVGKKPKSPLLTITLNDAERIKAVAIDKARREEMEQRRKEWRLPPYDH